MTMKTNKLFCTLLISLLLGWLLPLQAQSDSINADNTYYVIVEQEPSFPGGIDALYQYLGSNIIYPATATQKGIIGTVIVTFIVETDGSISNIKVLKDPGFGMSEEVVRVVNAMPRWTPAMQSGKPVRALFTLPVVFRLDDDTDKPSRSLFRRLFGHNR